MGPFETWIDAASHVWLRSLLGSLKDERLDAHGLYLTLSYLGQTSRVVDSAWQRFQEVDGRIRAADASSSWTDPLDLVGETRALVVAAHAFWQALDQLRMHLAPYLNHLPALADSTPYQAAVTSTQAARHHLEHFVERIQSGRERPRSSPMSVAVFRQAPAQVRDGLLRCGTECTDLVGIVATVQQASRAVGQGVARALQPRFSADVLPPLNSTPPQP